MKEKEVNEIINLLVDSGVFGAYEGFDRIEKAKRVLMKYQMNKKVN